MSQWNGCIMSLGIVIGTKALGREAILRIRFGRTASLTLPAVRRDTSIGSI